MQILLNADERKHRGHRARAMRRASSRVTTGHCSARADFTPNSRRIAATEVSRTGQIDAAPGFSLQSWPGEFLVHRDRHFRRAADPERFPGRLHRDDQGARSGHSGTVADDARGHRRNHHRQNHAAVSSAAGDGVARHRIDDRSFSISRFAAVWCWCWRARRFACYAASGSARLSRRSPGPLNRPS